MDNLLYRADNYRGGNKELWEQWQDWLLLTKEKSLIQQNKEKLHGGSNIWTGLCISNGTGRRLQAEGLGESENSGVKMYGVWGSGQAPGTRSDQAKRNATVGTWKSLNATLEISNWILGAANLNMSPKKDSTGLGDWGTLSTLEGKLAPPQTSCLQAALQATEQSWPINHLGVTKNRSSQGPMCYMWLPREKKQTRQLRRDLLPL